MNLETININRPTDIYPLFDIMVIATIEGQTYNLLIEGECKGADIAISLSEADIQLNKIEFSYENDYGVDITADFVKYDQDYLISYSCNELTE